MTKIVWVFGNSATGKNTFINTIATGKADNIKNSLGWTKHRIIKIQESLDYIGQDEDDPITDRRAEIIAVVDKDYLKARYSCLFNPAWTFEDFNVD